MRVMQAIRYGGPETIRECELARPTPGPGELLVRVEAAGINYIDIYHRTGLYPTEEPVRLGREGAGVVEAVGPGVTERTPGDRVAWFDVPGSYATHVVAPEARFVPVPAAVTSRQAAAAMLQGMTAHYLVHDTCPLKPGDVCLVHAAAGGVGLLLCQLARACGARVIGTVSSDEKAALARDAGAHDIVFYTREDLRSRVRALTDGKGVRVAYDSVGKDTWEASLDVLAPLGMLVLYGQSSGVVPPFDPARLARGGSLFLTRPTLFHYVATREALLARAGAVLGAVADGSLRLRIDHELPLREAARAHELLAARQTTGKLLLLPD